MALRPYSRDTMSSFWDWPHEREMPRRHQRLPVLVDQHFGVALSEEDMFPSGFQYLDRPRRDFGRQQTGSSEVSNNKNEFKVMLDVKHFSPKDIEVKTLDGRVVEIKAKHEEKMDDHGFISREFSRKYVLPEDVQVEDIQTNLSKDGVLTISVPKLAIEEGKPSEKKIPIKMGLTESGKSH